jgi:ADP-heptose:LPS heptosyltransferase
LLGAKSNHQEASQLKALLEQELSHLKVENLCGELELKDSIRMISSTQEFWGIDSGLLHYARLMGIPSLSYWGPTDPMTRLKPYDHLKEEIIYKRIPCSPCIHVAETPPCAGNNLCIKIHFEEQHKNVFHHLDDHRATRKKAG